jgi:ABC-type glucose/galactose transport system permease subunit
MASLACYYYRGRWDDLRVSARQANPQDIVEMELNVIAAVVLGGAQSTGGRGRVLGSAPGVILVVIASNSLVLIGAPTVWQRVVIGLDHPDLAQGCCGCRPGVSANRAITGSEA